MSIAARAACQGSVKREMELFPFLTVFLASSLFAKICRLSQSWRLSVSEMFSFRSRSRLAVQRSLAVSEAAEQRREWFQPRLSGLRFTNSDSCPI